MNAANADLNGTDCSGLEREVHLLQTRLQSTKHCSPTLTAVCTTAADSENKETEEEDMDGEPAPYQHRNLSQFVPNNHNIGLSDEQLVTIATKDFNKLLKNSGKMSLNFSKEV